MAGYLLKKFVRYMPLNLVSLLMCVWVLPFIGSGPIWNTFYVLVEPCQSYWWTNLFWINNLYPANFNEKCLPWTWYGSCYVQMSMTLPLLILVFRSMSNKLMAHFVYVGILVAFSILNFVVTYSLDAGATPIMNDKFFNNVFMLPFYHYPSFMIGMICSLVYSRYMKERQESQHLDSLASRILVYIMNNTLPRYAMFLVSLALMIGTFLW